LRRRQGGFSYVYLVQDTATSELFALKKIRCPFGAESVAQAMKEVEAYKLFAHSPGIIHSVDYAIATERGGGEESKTVYVLLPYYRRGNLQDMINANLVNHTAFPEKRLMQLFLGVCRALRDMHHYRGPGAGAGAGAGPERMEMRVDGVDENVRHAKGRPGADEDDETEQQRPLMTEDERLPPAAPGTVRSYAHRDIKPGGFLFLLPRRRLSQICTLKRPGFTDCVTAPTQQTS
jgi:serine/threonine kinase 16